MGKAFNDRKLVISTSSGSDSYQRTNRAIKHRSTGCGLGRVGVLCAQQKFTLEEDNDWVTCHTLTVSIIISVSIILESWVSRKG